MYIFSTVVFKIIVIFGIRIGFDHLGNYIIKKYFTAADIALKNLIKYNILLILQITLMILVLRFCEIPKSLDDLKSFMNKFTTHYDKFDHKRFWTTIFLVFIAQATITNISYWMKNCYKLVGQDPETDHKDDRKFRKSLIATVLDWILITGTIVMAVLFDGYMASNQNLFIES